MDNITLDLKLLQKSELSIEKFVLLQLIYEGVDITNPNWNVLNTDLEQFEREGYIKILDDTIEPRQKLLDLFANGNFNKEIDEIITHLNKVTGSKFGLKSEANRKFIRARLKEGYTVPDLKGVVDTMARKWLRTKFEEYLRPGTLFNAEKFQSYINQSGRQSEAPINEMM